MQFSWFLVEWSIASLLYLIAFLYAFKVAARAIKTVRGGRYATAAPYLLVGLGVLFVMELLFASFYFLSPAVAHSAIFQFSAQTLQIIAGVFFIKAFYQIYQMSYATAGIAEE
ncbi:hypothetical protein HY546_01000 [archaeon]|nr:hypothetical protein [archaeon]